MSGPLTRDEAATLLDEVLGPYGVRPPCREGRVGPATAGRAGPGQGRGGQAPVSLRSLAGRRRPSRALGDLERSFPGVRAGSGRPASTLGDDVIRDYDEGSGPAGDGRPLCPPQREYSALGQEVRDVDRDRAFYRWAFEQVVRTIVGAAIQDAAAGSLPYPGVQAWSLERYAESDTSRAAGDIGIHMSVRATFRVGAPALGFEVWASRRVAAATCNVRRSDGTVTARIASGTEMAGAGNTTIIRTAQPPRVPARSRTGGRRGPAGAPPQRRTGT